jgi:hypothetical protein
VGRCVRGLHGCGDSVLVVEGGNMIKRANIVHLSNPDRWFHVVLWFEGERELLKHRVRLCEHAALAAPWHDAAYCVDWDVCGWNVKHYLFGIVGSIIELSKRPACWHRKPRKGAK